MMPIMSLNNTALLAKKTGEADILSYKNVVYGKNRVRRNYSKVKTNVELPNLIEIQTKSFEWFLNEGIRDLFKEISPIKDYSEKYELYFGGKKNEI